LIGDQIACVSGNGEPVFEAAHFDCDGNDAGQCSIPKAQNDCTQGRAIDARSVE
jgi:hypothetical protein